MGLFLSKQAKAFKPIFSKALDDLFSDMSDGFDAAFDKFKSRVRQQGKEGGLSESDFIYFKTLAELELADPNSYQWKVIFRALRRHVKERDLL
jgi:hypothetical protein